MLAITYFDAMSPFVILVYKINVFYVCYKMVLPDCFLGYPLGHSQQKSYRLLVFSVTTRPTSTMTSS